MSLKYKHWFPVILSILPSLLVLYMLVSNTIAQSNPPTITPTVVPQISSTPDPLSANGQIDTLSYEETITFYGNMSVEAVRASRETIELAQNILLILATAATVATVLIGYIARSASRTEEAARNAKLSADESRKNAESAVKDANESLTKSETLSIRLSENLKRIQETEKETKRVQTEILAMRPINIKQLETVADIRICSIELFNQDNSKDIFAIKKLLNFAMDDDPVIRYESINSLMLLFDYETDNNYSKEIFDEIVNRLEIIAINDPEPALKLIARNSIQKLKHVR